MMTILGAGQADFKIADPEQNMAIIQFLLAEADRERVDILVLPELANSGYAIADRAEGLAVSEVVPDGPICRRLADWSRNGRLVVCGLCVGEGDELFNSAVVFGNGTFQGQYRKAHLFMKEQLIFSPGDEEPPVYQFQDAQVGVMICYDWAFPEMARILTLKGAELILHPSNLVLPYGQQAMVVRSIENGIFTATANRIGLERGIDFSGHSQITSPKGEVLSLAVNSFQGVIVAEVDLSMAKNKMITPFNHLFNDRRPELYSLITKPRQ
jgi:beta-ureidopropionase